MTHVVVEGSEHDYDDAIAALSGPVVRGFGGSGPGTRSGAVTSAEDAAAALLAAVAGARLVVHALADRETIDRFVDDLRRLGEVDHRVGVRDADVLTKEQRVLMRSLAGGASIAEAAALANVSRRTADRRIAEVRRALGAGTTAEAVASYRRSTH